MVAILRLEGLSPKARTEDVRIFFKGFQILDGGVFIVGGSLKETFIAFKTETDAQLALCSSGQQLKGSKVMLHTSSMEELKQRLDAIFQSRGKKAIFSREVSTLAKAPDGQRSQSTQTAANDSANLIDEKKALDSEPGYIKIYGVPSTVTKMDLYTFLNEPSVQEVIMHVKMGLSLTCLVKLNKKSDAVKALRFHHQMLRTIRIEVEQTDEKTWVTAMEYSKRVKISGFPSELKRRTTDILPHNSSKRIKPAFDKWYTWQKE